MGFKGFRLKKGYFTTYIVGVFYLCNITKSIFSLLKQILKIYFQILVHVLHIHMIRIRKGPLVKKQYTANK